MCCEFECNVIVSHQSAGDDVGGVIAVGAEKNGPQTHDKDPGGELRHLKHTENRTEEIHKLPQSFRQIKQVV